MTVSWATHPGHVGLPGVLGTIADEIQLQSGTFLEFISDEAGQALDTQKGLTLNQSCPHLQTSL